MKLTKKLAAIAACACMAITSMSGMVTSATYNDNTNSYAVNSELSVNATGYSTYTLDNYWNYEEQQIGESCWASCILSVINYQNSSAGITLEDIYTRINRLCGTHLSVGDGAPPTAVPVVANYYLGTQYKMGSLSDSEVINHIHNNEPIIAVFNQNGSANKHAMVIYGYGASNGVIDKYYVMNPTSGVCTNIAKSGLSWYMAIYYSNLI